MMTQATRKVFEDLFGLAQDYNGMIDKTKFLKILYITKSVGEPVESLEEYTGQEFFPANRFSTSKSSSQPTCRRSRVLPDQFAGDQEFFPANLPNEITKSVTAPFYKNQPEILQNGPFNESKDRIIWPNGKSPSLENNPTKEQVDATNISSAAAELYASNSTEIKVDAKTPFKKSSIVTMMVLIRRYGYPSDAPNSVWCDVIVDTSVAENLLTVELVQRWDKKNKTWGVIELSQASARSVGTFSLPCYLYGPAYYARPRLNVYAHDKQAYNYTSSNFLPKLKNKEKS